MRAELYRPRFCAHLGFYTKTCQKELVYETGRSNLKNEKRARRDAERKNGEKAAFRNHGKRAYRGLQYHRKTFYYHFEDIYALLKWTLEQEAIEVLKNFDLPVDAEEAINFVIDYIENNEYFVNCLYNSVGYSELKRFLYTDIIEIFSKAIENGAKKLGIKVDESFMRFLSDFYAEALTGLILSRLQGISHYKREEIVGNVLLICNVSVPQILIAHASKNIMD